jgi:hypothetical protein
MINEYENLFNAIWVNAITDDIKTAANQLYDYAFNTAYETYSISNVTPLDKHDKSFEKIKKEIQDFSKEIVQRLIPRIKEHVYKESQEWPNNSFLRDDFKYNFIFKLLKVDILKFAQEKMRNFQGSDK